MIPLAFAMAAFVGLHFLLSAHPMRGRLVARLGESLFRGLYSVLAAATLVWSVVAYNRAPFEPLWPVPAWLAHLPVAIMPLAVLLLVASLTQPNPTLAGRDRQTAIVTGGVLAITRHPGLWAIAIWALLHLFVNGDLASTVFFGGVALLAIGGAAAIDARKRREWPAERWAEFAGATSFVPFVALLAGRARLGLADLGWWRILLAAVVYAALLALHLHVIGVPAVPLG